MDKYALSARDICANFIMPALEASGRDRTTQFLEEFKLTNCRIVVRGNKVKRYGKTIRRADHFRYVKPGWAIAIVAAIVADCFAPASQTQCRLTDAPLEQAVA